MGSQEAKKRQMKEEQKLIQQLPGQLQQAQGQVKANCKENELQVQAQAADAQVAKLKAQLQAQETLVRRAQEISAQHQGEVERRSVRIAELAERVEAATGAWDRERQGRQEDAQDASSCRSAACFRSHT